MKSRDVLKGALHVERCGNWAIGLFMRRDGKFAAYVVEDHYNAAYLAYYSAHSHMRGALNDARNWIAAAKEAKEGEIWTGN